MKINGAISRKLGHYSTVLIELKKSTPLTVEQLEANWLLRRSVERDLQVLIGIMIDICIRVAELSTYVPVHSGSEAVDLCHRLGVLASVEPWQKMMQFRNRIVYGYEFIDLQILSQVVNDYLIDFERFRDAIVPYLNNDNEC